MHIDVFFSDPHWGHTNILQLAHRPFSDIHEMNDALISNYNRIVKPDDHVLWLGDCFFKGGKEWKQETMKRLNGRKSLLLGNHDTGMASMLSLGFELVIDDTIMISMDGVPCRICHYSSVSRVDDERYKDRLPPKVKGEWLIHGHTHSNIKMEGNRICVCCDAWDYGPVRMEWVKDLVKKANPKKV